MRCLLVLVCAACSAPAVPTPSSRIGALDAWVIDPNGPVANAEVRVVSLAPARCACTPKPDDGMFDNAVPECACPEELEAWRQRLAHCTWPTRAMQVTHSDARGRVALDQRALGSAIEATTAHGVKWLTLPARADRVAIELGEPRSLRLQVDNAAELRAALLYDDGHCMPFRRSGANVWITAAPIPRSEEAPVLIVEAPGFATIVRADYESDDELALALHRAQPVSGTCAGDLVRLENPFQQLVARPDKQHRFRIDGALDVDSSVSCLKRGDVIEDWAFSPADGLRDAVGFIGGGFGGSCHDVEVVDRAGRPIANAEIGFFASTGAGQLGSGYLTYTGAQGRACVEDVSAGGALVVHPPLDRGGQCAGEARLRVTQQQLTKPIRIVLEIRELERARFRGRVLSPEKIPVAGAHVAVRDLQPVQEPDCTERSDTAVTTGADGAFELPPLPRGTVTIEIQHDWYAEQHVDVVVPGPEREIVLGRGATWIGRVLDPDGKNIERCDLFLTLADQRLLTAKCSTRGFRFTTLVPGEAKLRLRVENHALGTFRQLDRTIQIVPSKHVEDVQWPAGETIAGRVVDARGVGVPGARLTALPKGAHALPSQFHPDEVMLEADATGSFTFRHLRPGIWVITGDRRSAQQATHELKTGTLDVRFAVP